MVKTKKFQRREIKNYILETPGHGQAVTGFMLAYNRQVLMLEPLAAKLVLQFRV